MENSYFLSDEKVGLNKLTVDAMSKNYFNWLNDAEVTSGIEAGVFPSTQEDIENYVRSANSGKDSVLFGIFSKDDNMHVGNIRVSSINSVNRNCMMGIIIGEKEGRGKGYGISACKLAIEYAFTTLNLDKIWLYVFEDNTAARKMYEKLGFVVEGELKKHFFKNGKFHNIIIMSLFRNH
ncbi:MAG: GNAT family N-acetyltransferase [Bacteroidia bacterium]|nr:GNAT family N-acetyltransferase [Bacteroidia bacterium]